MSIVDKINEKTGKFANNIAEAVADLLGKDLKATTIVENIGDGNNIQEAIDNLSGKQSANIMEAIDNYNGDDTPKSMTIEEALENTEGPGPEPEPGPDFQKMTKAELQEYAKDNYVYGVNKDAQTKEEMITRIEDSLSSRIFVGNNPADMKIRRVDSIKPYNADYMVKIYMYYPGEDRWAPYGPADGRAITAYTQGEAPEPGDEAYVDTETVYPDSVITRGSTFFYLTNNQITHWRLDDSFGTHVLVIEMALNA